MQKLYNLINNPICQFLLLYPEQLEPYSDRHDLCLHFQVFSLNGFKVLCVTLSSLIHFELIFVQDEE
jgi:hypothetical protein